jgi:competence protein ComEC
MLSLLFSLLACGGSTDVVPTAVAQAIPAVDATTTWSAPTGNNIRVDVMDVGQGDSILIRTPTKTILIDASEGVADVDKKLTQLGVQAIDLAVATHPHADHIGGMDEVVRAFPIKMYMDNGLPHDTQTYTRLMADIEAKGITYRAAVAGTVINLDLGAKFEVLFPTGTPLTGTRSDLNANSVVTRLSYKDDCFLFVGDSEEPTERALLSRGLGACEVLKVAHHGSEYSSIQPFLDAVRPEVALISVGKGNSYGHPGPATLGRLQAMGARIYRTDLQGTITLTTTGSGVRVTTGTIPGGTSGSGTSATTGSSTAGDCPYFSSGSSEVFHEASCGQGARILPEKRICYSKRDDAIKAGKRPGGCCLP